jgi:hypothetical protein
MGYIWKYFLDLNSKRQSGMGISPISYTEILSYFTLYGIQYDDYEIAMIEVLDRVALEHFSAKQKAEEARNKKRK